jgi:hypothetical protein
MIGMPKYKKRTEQFYAYWIMRIGNAKPKYALSAFKFFIALTAFDLAFAFVFPEMVAT